jgi:hypothetical protein
MPIITIDFEASCLPCHGRSFPIEVGIASDAAAARSWLIRPHPDWVEWDWTDEAQALHGLTRRQLDREGLPIDLVVDQLANAVRGHRVIADSYLDNEWLDTLVKAAGVSPPCRIGHVEEVIDRLGATPDDIARAQAALARQPFARHRAGDDARWLASFIAQLERQALTDKPRVDAALFHWPPATGLLQSTGYAAAA